MPNERIDGGSRDLLTSDLSRWPLLLKRQEKSAQLAQQWRCKKCLGTDPHKAVSDLGSSDFFQFQLRLLRETSGLPCTHGIQKTKIPYFVSFLAFVESIRDDVTASDHIGESNPVHVHQCSKSFTDLVCIA